MAGKNTRINILDYLEIANRRPNHVVRQRGTGRSYKKVNDVVYTKTRGARKWTFLSKLPGRGRFYIAKTTLSLRMALLALCDSEEGFVWHCSYENNDVTLERKAHILYIKWACYSLEVDTSDLNLHHLNQSIGSFLSFLANLETKRFKLRESEDESDVE